MTNCKLYCNFAAEFKNEFTMFNLKFYIMKQKENKSDEKEIKSYKEMLIYEMSRTEHLESEIRHYKNRIRNLEEYVDYLERKTHLY